MSGSFLRLVQVEEMVVRAVTARKRNEDDPVAVARKRLRHLRDRFQKRLRIKRYPMPTSPPAPLAPATREHARRISAVILALHLGVER